MYGLLTKCEVKMAGYFPSSFFCVFLDRDEVEVNKLAKKKKTKKISSHLDRTNLVNKGFIIWLSGKFFLWDTAGSPEWARWLHLARLGSQSHRVIWVILPVRGASRIIRWISYLPQYIYLNISLHSELELFKSPTISTCITTSFNKLLLLSMFPLWITSVALIKFILTMSINHSETENSTISLLN